MKKLLCFLGGALLLSNVQAQQITVEPYSIGERLPDLSLTKVINYKDSVASFSDFGDKLIILDFWGVHCGSCIEMFPKEDSLQKQLTNDVQFVLVTSDKPDQVKSFLSRYNESHHSLPFPMIVSDKLLNKLFRFTYIPHYVWIAPNGGIIAETSDYLITKEVILNALVPIRQEEARTRGTKYADFNLKFQKPDKELTLLLNLLNN